ncbi:beta/alpha barrel domain-containing protein [Clostridium sp. JNZ X4-2]
MKTQFNDTLKFIDSTLRDGCHALSRQPAVKEIENICAELDKTGLYALDVGLGTGIGDSVTLALIKTARDKVKKSKLMSLIAPGKGTLEDLREAAAIGLDVIRIAVLYSQGAKAVPFIELAKKLKLETGVFLMASSLGTAKELAEQSKVVENAEADFVYIGDSIGAMTSQDIYSKINAVKNAAAIPMGIHTHNNLGLGVSNAIAGIKTGCEFMDGTIEGLGGGGGNGNLQALIAVCEKLGIKTGIDFNILNKIAKENIRPIMTDPQELKGEDIAAGFSGRFPKILKGFK